MLLRLLDRHARDRSGPRRRFLSRGAAVAAAALILIGFSPTALAAGYVAGQPMAAARDFCSPGDPNSVTVVVDFSGVGGGVDIRCAPVSAGATGAQALSAAGFGIAGTVHDGPGFVCRIDGEPASDPCVDTPSTSAYWSYHQAEAGGGWSYSSRGYTSSRVKPGGFEGWSFGSGGSPGVSPVLPAAPAPEPEPAPEPAPEAQQPAEQPAADPAAPQADAGAGTGDTDQDGNPAADQEPATTAADADAAAAQAAADAQAAAEAQAFTEAQAAADAAAAQAAAEAAAAQAAAESAAALAAQSAAASSSAAAAAPSSPRATAGGPVTSSADSSALSANEPAGGSTIWFSVIALLAVASLGSAAVVMSRRRRLGASGGADGAGAGTTDGPGDGAGPDDRTG